MKNFTGSKDSSPKQQETLRNRGGLWLGKLTALLSRLTGKGGSSLPGFAAALLAPGLLACLAQQVGAGNIIITGTNGKTTSASLLTKIFAAGGLKVINNHTGANLIRGITSAYIEAASWQGSLKGDKAVMETDEADFSEAVRIIAPQSVIVTNIFRDQLDRYGEVESVRRMIQKGINSLARGSSLLLNADDPMAATMTAGEGINRVYWGLEFEPPFLGHNNTASDLNTCPLCESPLLYDKIYFSHLGHYRCSRCSFRRPNPDVKLVKKSPGKNGSSDIRLVCGRDTIDLTFPLPGVYNLYNALAAAASAYADGIEPSIIKQTLEKAIPSFGRMEQLEAEGKKLLLGLIKNPAGANEVLRTFLERPGPLRLLMVINDNYADGTDISWLWDVDFEWLAGRENDISFVVLSGNRGEDMALRLKYAGLSPALLLTEKNCKKALATCLKRTPEGGELLILPTYTAMLELRKLLHHRGHVKPFWEE